MATDNFSELSRMIEQIGKDKGIDRQIVVEAVVQGMLQAARKKFGTYRDIEAKYDEETGEIELYEFKEVVKKEDFIDEEIEIIMEEARELDPDIQLNDSIGIKLDSKDLGRIAAQAARQIITSRVRDAERDLIFSEFESRKGEIASGIARRVERGSIVVDLGRTEAFIPYKEQIPGEQYKPGDRIEGYILEVKQLTRGPQIIMSRACEQYMIKLFEQHVPELSDGTIEIIRVAREAGARAKMAVVSKDPSVDPVGACVGMKGTRVEAVRQELKGEKIDIFPYEEEITRLAVNALLPAEISRVFLDEVNREMEVVVPDDQLSLAIGKKGQNVRLAGKILGWKLDILSDSAASARTAESVLSLMKLPNMTETMAQNIFQSGFGSFQALADAATSEVLHVPGYDDPEKAQRLIEDARALVKKYKDEGLDLKVEETSSHRTASTPTTTTGGSAAKATADQRLKAELAALKKSDEQAEKAADETEKS